MKRFLKYGVTTGLCAAAAAKAALMALVGDPPKYVGVPTPLGIRFEMPVKMACRLSEDSATATVVKDAGDDADVTDNAEITVSVRLTDDAGIVLIRGGKGVGTVTKAGLQVPVGEAAINPAPKQMITAAVEEALPPRKGVEVTVSVPAGESLAGKTLNPKLGVSGGISILGTTGVVKPLSLEAYRRALIPQVDVAIAQGHSRMFLVPGNIGEKTAKKLFNVSDDAIVQTGDFIGYMLDRAVEKGAKEIVLVGHPGKLVKVAAGIFNTHHKVADARNEVVAAYAAAAGADVETVKTLLAANTTEEAAQLLSQKGLLCETFNAIAEKCAARISERAGGRVKVAVVMVLFDGKVAGVGGAYRSMKLWAE